MKSGDVRADVVKLWSPPPRQTVYEWAQEHFIVTTGVDAIRDPWVDDAAIRAAPQALKTIMLGRAYVRKFFAMDQ